MKSKIDSTVDLFKKKGPQIAFIAVMDLTVLGSDDLRWLLYKDLISIPVLVRNLIAIKQNGVQEILLQYSSNQFEVRRILEDHPLIGSFLSWYELNPGESMNPDFLKRMEKNGCCWIHPHYLMNGIFLTGFMEALQGNSDSPREIIKNQISKDSVLWLSKPYIQNLISENGSSFKEHLRSDSKEEVIIEDPEVEGQEVRSLSDVGKAEKIICRDITRKKGGPIAKILNEPISLWIAKQCAKTNIQPNTITVLNTLLGLFSAFLVVWGGFKDLYWPIALGGLLFYLADIFDGIDGELARFTFRLHKHGALYDTLSDNSILLAIFAASTYAAYQDYPHPFVIYLGISMVAMFVGLVLYLLLFCLRHFKNASLRFYEARFVPLLPRKDFLIQIILFMKVFYTKDIFAALITFALVINQPILILFVTNGLLILMFTAFIYMGFRYGHLIEKEKSLFST